MSKYYHFKCLLLAMMTSFSLLVDLDINKVISISKTNSRALPLFIVTLFFFWFYEKFLKKNHHNKVFMVISLLFSLFMVVGYSYDIVGSAALVTKSWKFVTVSIIKFISFYYLFMLTITFLYNVIVNYNWKEKVTKSKIIQLFLKHPFLFSFCFIIICYIPYLYVFYPAVMSPDPANQIKEVMGIPTRYMNSVILLDPNQTLTNFNPLIHTFLIGGCFKFGNWIGNVNFGLFLYTCIQTVIMAATFAYAITYMKKQGVQKSLLILSLLIFALVPVFPFYAVATVKDTIFSCFVLLFVIRLFDFIRNGANFKDYVILTIVCMMVTLFRNNGIFVIVFTLPFLLIAQKKERKQITLVLAIVMVLYIGYGKVLLPSFKISNTSIREVLSIPFQQTARVVKNHYDEIPEEEVEIIDYLLQYKTLGERYNPTLSDPVKNQYNKYATNKDLMNYFQVWFKQLWRYPVDYFDATIHNIYGYFYPNTSSWYIYTGYNTKLREAGFDYHFTSPESLRKAFIDFGKVYPYIPLLGMFVNIGLVVWIYFLMFGFLLVNKKGRYLPVLIPAFVLILVCVASPVNTYFRYAQPYTFALPVTMFLLYQILTKEKKKSL